MALSSLLAGALYGWGLTRGAPHYYYSAAMRSMTLSWHNFFFGAFDPAGSITTDKLPGSLWVHAIFVWLFGMHDWVLLLPELLAAVATVPLLFGAVRRWAGQRAAFIAVGVFLLTPVIFATAQVNIPDTLMVLCVVAGAYALSRSFDARGWGWLALSAVLLGIGFQMKMLEALLVLPVFGLAYLVGAARPLRVRMLATVGYGLVTLAVSLSWIIVVGLVPAGSRPKIDGSSSNSLWDMVFVYNGIGRSGSAQDNAFAALFGGPAGPLRLFDDKVSGEISWLLPLAVLLLVVGLVTARGKGRRELAGWLLWGGWLAICAAAFSVVSEMHPYYTVLMAPAVAALVGVGVDRAWGAWRARRSQGWLLPLGVVLTVAWTSVVLLRVPVGLDWLVPVVLVAGVIAVVVFSVHQLSSGRVSVGRQRAVLVIAAAAGALALFAAPATWMLGTPPISANPSRESDPIAGPAAFQALDEASMGGGGGQAGLDLSLLHYVQAHNAGERFLFAAGQASIAAPYIGDGQDVLPLQGFTDLSSSVDGAGVASMVSHQDFRYVLMLYLPTGTPTALSAEQWVRARCAAIPATAYEPAGHGAAQRWAPTLYDCRQSDGSQSR
ncbi:MAG TPA: glycosyltransferase family 39 protein [Pseudonocardiaceae bacterium]|nr:glycosyltransferase family 39 protein [Pseudonocardiaceae bacterium]